MAQAGFTVSQMTSARLCALELTYGRAQLVCIVHTADRQAVGLLTGPAYGSGSGTTRQLLQPRPDSKAWLWPHLRLLSGCLWQ